MCPKDKSLRSAVFEVPHNIGAILARLRTLADLRQSQVAAGSRLDQSRISRIENGEIMPNPSEVKTYLKAIPIKESRAYLTYLEKQWRILQRPDASNPDVD